MVLQALFDESGSKGQDRFMAMAGLVAEAQVVASLAEQWEKGLRAAYPGRISYFKMDEAVNLSGEFRHWSEENRDAKIRQMAKVIDRDNLFFVGAALDLHAYERILGPWRHHKNGDSLRHPYLMLCDNVLAAACQRAIDVQAGTRLEIVYDEHAKYRPMFAQAFKEYVASVLDDPLWEPVMPYQPWFRDDRDFVMLQASDMLAGEMRLVPVDAKPAPLVEGLCPNLMLSGRAQIIDARVLDALVAFLRKQGFEPAEDPGA